MASGLFKFPPIMLTTVLGSEAAMCTSQKGVMCYGPFSSTLTLNPKP